MITYGYDNVSNIQEIKDKKIETCVENYGVENPMFVEEIRNKIVNTFQTRYGCDNASQVEEFKIKAMESQRLTLYKNGTAPSSKQQEYLHLIIGGEFNYPEGHCSIDIALLNDKIAIEYDGGYHDAMVKLGKISQEDFEKKEFKREKYLNSKGWKIIRIISKEDYMPYSFKVIDIVNFAKDYLKGHSWIQFNIDENSVKGSKLSGFYDFWNIA